MERLETLQLLLYHAKVGDMGANSSPWKLLLYHATVGDLGANQPFFIERL